MVDLNPTRMELMQEVAALNESFAQGALLWHEWSERVTPLLRALNPALHRPAALER